MATKEHSTHEMGACVCDCQSYHVKPVVFRDLNTTNLNIIPTSHK